MSVQFPEGGQADPQDPGAPRSAPSPPVDFLVWEGKHLPCLVKVVVYAAGQAAALGIKSSNPPLLREFLAEEERQEGFRLLLSQQVHVEVERQGVVSGLKEEEVAAAIEEFVAAIVAGTDSMVSRKIAQGELPQAGEDGWLEYALNPGGLSIRDLGREEQQRALRRTYQARQGEALVVLHPPAGGKEGRSVRGERIAPARPAREVSLQGIGGVNTLVQGQKLVAALDGLYQEDRRGRVWVVQELAVDEVNRTTGDLPRSGVAAVNVLVRKGVMYGASVQSSENVFVGTQDRPGILEADTRVRARHLLVRGLVAGSQLPAAYLRGEVEALEERSQRQIRSELDKSQVEVEQLFAAREVAGRNLRAGKILVQGQVYAAGLEAQGEVRVDGDLVGGVAVCRCLRVLGDLGNQAGATTRVRLNTSAWEEGRRAQAKAELQAGRAKWAALQEQLSAHQDRMEGQARKSPYWALLLRGEKRVPRRPMEKQLLAQFLQAVKQKKQLEQEMAAAQRQVQDLVRLFQEMAPPPEEDGAGMQIVVGGTVHPGVGLEMVRLIEPEDLDRKVKRLGQDTTLAAVKAELAQALERYLELYQAGVEERQKDLELMFKGREKRPATPQIPDKRFQAEVEFAEEEDGKAGAELVVAGLVYAQAHDPRNFYLKQVAQVKEPRQRVVFTVEKSGQILLFKCVSSLETPVPWQQDPQVLEELEGISVLGRSGRQHLLG